MFLAPYVSINVDLTMSTQSLLNIQLYDINGHLKYQYKFSVESVPPIQNVTNAESIQQLTVTTTKSSINIFVIMGSIAGGILILIILIICYRKYSWCKHAITNT